MRFGPTLISLSVMVGGCFADTGKGDGSSSDGTSGTSDGTGGPTTGDPSSTSAGSQSGSATDSTTTGATDSATTDATTSVGATDATASAGTTDATTGGSSSGGSTGGAENCDGFDGQIIYINHEGATLTKGLVDNAPGNITADDALVGDWGDYVNPDLPQVFDLVVQHWAPYDVCVTIEKPTALDYNMIVLQDDTFNGNPNFVGVGGTPDCDDTEVNNVDVVVLSDEAGLGVGTKAVAISKFAARRFFGLESVSNASDDLMNSPIGSTMNSATFTDNCLTKQVNPPLCATNENCANDQQRAHSYLVNTVGPA